MKTAIGSVKPIAVVAAISLILAAGACAAAVEVGDETAAFSVKPVLTGLDNPCGLAVRPGHLQNGSAELFVAESGALRVVAISTSKPDDLREVIVGFPEGSFGGGFRNGGSRNGGSQYKIGPLGLLFLTRTKLVVGGGGLAKGEELLRVYSLPPSGTVLSAEQMDHSLGPVRAGGRSAVGEGDFFGLAKTADALFVTSHGDDSQGWILKSPIEANRLTDLQPFIATKKLTGTGSPTGIVVNRQRHLQYLVVGQMGSTTATRNSLLCFYSPRSGSLALSLSTELHDIVGLAYSPSGNLYAVDFAFNAEQDGGVYRLDEVLIDGRQACRPVKIAAANKPTALVFAPDGALYVTALGTSHGDAGGGPANRSGVLLKITGDL